MFDDDNIESSEPTKVAKYLQIKDHIDQNSQNDRRISVIGGTGTFAVSVRRCTVLGRSAQ